MLFFIQQIQRNFPTNQVHYQQQPRYQVPPYYGVQQNDSRYNSYNIGNPNLTSPDVDWQQQHNFPQQQPRQQQQIMNPYIQKVAAISSYIIFNLHILDLALSNN